MKAQCYPGGSDLCTASPVAVPPLAQVSLSSLFLDGLYGSGPSGHRGDAVVARRDARLVRQVHYPSRSQMIVTTDASSHGWGGWWQQFDQTGNIRHEAWGFWFPHEQGMASNARELCRVFLTVQVALPSLCGKQMLVEMDNKATNHLCESPRRSVSFSQQHRPSPSDDVL